MAKLSVSAAWDEGARFAGREFRLLYPVALLLLELPVLLFALIAPAQPEAASMLDLEYFVNRFGAGPMVFAIAGLTLAVFAIQTFGGLAITWLALRPGTSVGESFAVAARRLPSVLGAILLIGIGLAIAMVPLWLLLIGASPRPSPSTGMGIFLIGILFILLFIAVCTRLALVSPVGVAERLGPVGILARSWNLTAGHFWRLFGALLLIGIVFLIVAILVGLVFGLLVLALVGSPITDPTAAFVLELLTSLFNAAVAVLMISFIARIYAQLSGKVEETGQVFT